MKTVIQYTVWTTAALVLSTGFVLGTVYSLKSLDDASKSRKERIELEEKQKIERERQEAEVQRKIQEQENLRIKQENDRIIAERNWVKSVIDNKFFVVESSYFKPAYTETHYNSTKGTWTRIMVPVSIENKTKQSISEFTVTIKVFGKYDELLVEESLTRNWIRDTGYTLDDGESYTSHVWIDVSSEVSLKSKRTQVKLVSFKRAQK